MVLLSKYSKQNITYLFVYVLDFVFALTQNIFTFGFSHQKLANFVCAKVVFVSLSLTLIEFPDPPVNSPVPHSCWVIRGLQKASFVSPHIVVVLKIFSDLKNRLLRLGFTTYNKIALSVDLGVFFFFF